MKRIVSVILATLLISIFSACSGQAVELTEQPALSPTATESTSTQDNSMPTEPTPKPALERESYSLMDIFGEEFNPFGMEWPCTVVAASFDKGAAKLDGRNLYRLLMTGSGIYACIAYHADVAGLGLDEAGKLELLEEYRTNGYLEFTGADGRIVTVRQANPDDDRYEYVEADGNQGFTGAGCVIELTYFVPDSDLGKYTQLVRDNYSVEGLAVISDYLNVETDFAECSINANLHKGSADVSVVYSVPNIDTVRENIAANVKSDWWEWNGNMETEIGNSDAAGYKLTFDSNSGVITVSQWTKGFNAPEGSLTALGFDFDEAGVCGVYEQREPHYISIAITRPEWSEHPDGWNIEFMDSDVNGYSVIMWYYADEDRYDIQIDRDNVSAKYTYFTKGELDFCYPDTDTVRQMFNAAFGTEGDSFYHMPFELFMQYVQENFGMSVDELYAAPKQ